ncbi:MAG: 50S ribosomal protein L21 [Candidatus Omnitrophica bacterium]|nr:50S ribosomal protein L21 [Candidatus Omnitrophota bacterium]
MYAVIEVGGKQHKVTADDVILVEKQEVEPGKDITFDRVLLVVDEEKVSIGDPYVKGASVLAQVTAAVKGPKLISFKYRRRKSSHTKKGHRQQLSRVQIKKIKQ